MNRKECVDRCIDTVKEIQGVDDFKDLVQRLQMFQKNIEEYSVSDVTLPSYFWVARRGGGISTCISALAEYMYAAKIIEFTGNVKFFEFDLAYVSPNAFFSELPRLNNAISEVAGHHRYFRGLACINIDEWEQHTNEEHFYKFLEYIASKNDKVLTVFSLHSDNKRVVENIESSLSSCTRFETIWLRFPDAGELLEYVDAKYFKQRGFNLADDAKLLLGDSITEIMRGKNFYGFVTIKKYANDVIFGLLTSELKGYEINADMLSEFNKDSVYIKRLKTFVSVNNTIGFSSSLEV